MRGEVQALRLNRWNLLRLRRLDRISENAPETGRRNIRPVSGRRGESQIRMDQIITLLPGDWLTTEETAKALGKHERTVQKMAKAGLLKWKLADRPGTGRGRLYDANDVKEHLPNAPRPQPQEPHRRRLVASPKLLGHKLTQTERALDTISIVGNLVAGHKAELQMLIDQSAQNLETVVTLILNAQKEEAAANRERLKAEREDARERWEIERQDRLERLKHRLTPQPTAFQAKTRKAHG